MERLVDEGADLNRRNRWRESALMLACSYDQLNIVDFLTSHGADVNAENIWGETSLMYAAERGHFRIVKLLLGRGSRVNQTDQKGETALMHAVLSLCAVPLQPPFQCIPKTLQICNDIYACRTTSENLGAAEVLSALLDAGSNVQATNCCGQTSLMMAAMHGRARLVELLLEKTEAQSRTSIINTTCNHQLTALTYASIGGHSQVIKVLLKYKTFVNNMPEEVGQAVNMAVICDYPEIVDMLLNANLIQDTASYIYLGISQRNACRRGKVDSAKLLLDYRTAIEQRESQQRSEKLFFLAPVWQGHTEVVHLFEKIYYRRRALWAAFICGHMECLESIHRASLHSNKHLRPWKKSARGNCMTSNEVKNQNKISWPNLLDAVACGNGDTVRSLLQFDGSLVNKESATGLTALAYACMYGFQDVVAELLAKSARADKADIIGCNPLMYAARFGHASCVRLLLRVNCNVNESTCRSSVTALTLAAEMGHIDIVQMLLTAGTDIPKRKRSALHVAASAGGHRHRRIIEILEKARYDVNLADSKGQTPLMYAASSGNDTSVNLLLRLGADRDLSDAKGRTALSMAAGCGKMAVVKLLLHECCSITKSDKYSAMPIWHAAKNGYPEVVDELLNHEISAKHSSHASDYELDSLPLKRLHTRALKANSRTKQCSSTVNNVCKTDGSTPLMHMCQYGFHHTVANLCTNGAILDYPNSEGQTALHVAAGSNRDEVCRVLLVYGARADVRDKQGLTPLLLALSRGHLKLLPVLEHASMDTSEGSAVQRQVECNSSEGSASGGMWISFKSRLRLSFRRRPQQQLAHAVGRETSREAKADQVRGREMAVPVNSKSMTDRSHHNSSDEESE